jgi:hypothetical protein
VTPRARVTLAAVAATALLAAALSAVTAFTVPVTAAPATGACPAGYTCVAVPMIITDHARGMGAPFMIEDNEGRPPGQNAPMFWVDGFQVGSVNPVCADATVPFLARRACLGGPPFNATGGHPVVSLWDGRQWQVLTARDIAWLHGAEKRRPAW